MSRRHRHRNSDPSGLIVFIIALAILEAVYHNKDFADITPYAFYVFASVIGLGIVMFTYRSYKKVQLRRRMVTLEEVDYMSGLDFEQYIADLLRKHGFEKVRLTEKYDMGVDIVAEKNGQRWGIQTKRYRGQVKADAVRQVVAGLSSYKCDRSMVITNSTFSGYAIRLAKNNHCILINRMELARLMSDVTLRKTTPAAADSVLH